MHYKFFIIFFALLLQGCTTPGWQSVRLQDYLQPYIGQSADDIQQKLNLKDLGFQTLKQPKKTTDTLTYSILRPINIPIPADMGTSLDGSRLSTKVTYNQSYDVNFYCHIIFELDQQQIARSIRYEGKAC
ncbi:hypothetical protein [Acinetobacter haemolyticus]|uniref:hypothetical protein n=1 Tax=Acinetobacter haemolyticus TaxID=29430 RepID=UPI000F7373DE|nr:hypothetical protein [Acinetobacter haemolyticus]RSN78496.1 hypothetical protein EA769_01540 [Acinetobacter haemolyticus]